MTEVSYGFTHVQDDVWLSLTYYEHVRAQEIIPTDWPLSFHLAFIEHCSDLDMSLGTYAMGWEL